MSSNGIQSVISDSNVVTNHPTMGEPFGKALIELAKENDKIVGLSAATNFRIGFTTWVCPSS